MNATLLLLLAGTAGDAPGPIPAYVVHRADGEPLTGPVARVEDDWTVVLGGNQPVRVNGADLVSLRQAGAALPGPPTDPHVAFFNGDFVPGTVREIGGDRVRFRARIGAGLDLTIPLSALAAIQLADADSAGRRTESIPFRTGGRRDRDRVVLRNGDVLEGALEKLGPATLVVEVNRKPVEVKRDQVAAVWLNTELARTLRPKTPYGRVLLANGCRLALASATVQAGKLTGQTLFGAQIGLPFDQVRALDVYQGRAVYLSDLKPRAYRHTPYFGVSWPWRADRSVTGNDLRLAGNFYAKGLGLHSQARVSYDLAGKYQWFEALVGLDEQSGQAGSVRVQLLVDGQAREVGQGKELTARAGPLPVRIQVSGGRELTLVVEFGKHGDIQDHVNWADARLIK